MTASVSSFVESGGLAGKATEKDVAMTSAPSEESDVLMAGASGSAASSFAESGSDVVMVTPGAQKLDNSMRRALGGKAPRTGRKQGCGGRTWKKR